MTLKFQFAHAVVKGFNVVFTEMADPRTSTYFLIPNPFPLGCIMLAYILFVAVIGPRIMEGRRPFKLRRWYVLYNVFAMLFNLRMFYKGARYWFFEYDSMCGTIQRSKNDLAMELTHYVYLHFVLKLLELLHTVILILSKRNHTTYPHIIKHSMLIGLSWCCVKYYPGSHCIFLAFVDSTIGLIVHFIFLLIDGNEVFDTYWTWKKRAISIKLVEYQIIILHLLEQYTYGCDYSKLHLIFVIPLSFFLTNAFVNYDHEDKLDELFRLYKEEAGPKKYKFQ